MLIKRVQERMSSHTVLDGRGYGGGRGSGGISSLSESLFIVRRLMQWWMMSLLAFGLLQKCFHLDKRALGFLDTWLSFMDIRMAWGLVWVDA